MKVTNMKSKRTGRAIPNQLIITTKDGIYFQSYNSIIVFKGHGKTQLDRYYWDYSKTTGKYRNQFLNETRKETERKIANGTYELTDLN